MAGFDVQHLMSTGSIGGLDAEIGDLVLSTSCMTMDAYSLASFHQEAYEDGELGRVVELKGDPPPEIPVQIRSWLAQEFGCKIRIGRLFTVPAVSWETVVTLESLRERGFIGVDLETGPFLAACRRTGVRGLNIHWVTDLPLRRDFYYQYEGDPAVTSGDERKKHFQWLNLPRLILPIVKHAIEADVSLAPTTVT
jgi:purine-nucleoside phosphorylase